MSFFRIGSWRTLSSCTAQETKQAVSTLPQFSVFPWESYFCQPKSPEITFRWRWDTETLPCVAAQRWTLYRVFHKEDIRCIRPPPAVRHLSCVSVSVCRESNEHELPNGDSPPPDPAHPVCPLPVAQVTQHRSTSSVAALFSNFLSYFVSQLLSNPVCLILSCSTHSIQ